MANNPENAVLESRARRVEKRIPVDRLRRQHIFDLDDLWPLKGK
jgi:hypothetical protein